MSNKEEGISLVISEEFLNGNRTFVEYESKMNFREIDFQLDGKNKSDFVIYKGDNSDYYNKQLIKSDGFLKIGKELFPLNKISRTGTISDNDVDNIFNIYYIISKVIEPLPYVNNYNRAVNSEKIYNKRIIEMKSVGGGNDGATPIYNQILMDMRIPKNVDYFNKNTFYYVGCTNDCKYHYFIKILYKESILGTKVSFPVVIRLSSGILGYMRDRVLSFLKVSELNGKEILIRKFLEINLG